MTQGIIYVATGQKWLDEALFSAASAKRHMPDIAITLFTDSEVESPFVNQVVKITNPAHGLRDKVQYMKRSPYDRSLFLDTDTYLCADIQELFQLLDRFEFAAVHEGGHQGYPLEDVPDSFPEYNSGVLLFQNTARVHQIFDTWLKRYDSETWQVRGRHFDQPALRHSLFHSDILLATLTSQYNCRFEDGGYLTGAVKILHRRSAHRMEDVERVLNSYRGQRVYIGNSAYKKQITGRLLRRMQSKLIGRFSRPFYALAWERLQKYLKSEGVFGLLQRTWQRLVGQKID